MYHGTSTPKNNNPCVGSERHLVSHLILGVDNACLLLRIPERMPKRSRASALSSCYGTDAGVQHVGGERKNDPMVPCVEYRDGRRFWSDRFYLNSSETSSASSIHHQQQQHADSNCGDLEPPPTFPLVDFVNHSLDVKASVMGTFNLHPEWFRERFPRFGASPSSEEEWSDDSKVAVPTFILHGHRGLENALAKRVKQADQVEYETDREEEDDDGDSKKNTPRSISGDSSSKFQFFLPPTPKATEAARHFVDNPSLQLCQVHCNWEKIPKKKASPRRVSVSSDKENSEALNATINRETKFGVHHPKFFLLFEQSGDLVVIITTSNLTPTNRSSVEGSWVQRFRRRIKTSNAPRNHQHQENDFGPVLQDFLVQLSEAAAAGPGKGGKAQIPLASSDGKGESHESSSNRLPLEGFLWKHIGLRSLSDFSSLYHFETAQAYLVPIIPGDYEYDASSAVKNSDNEKPRYFYGRQRVRYILDNLAISTPMISKKTQDKSKSDRLLLQPTSLGSDWSRSQFASLVREYMGYHGCGGSNSKTPAQKAGETTTPPVNTKRKSLKKQKRNHDYSYHRDDFWVCNQADIVWPSDQFMIGAAKSLARNNTANNNGSNIISPLQAAANKKGSVMNSFIFNSSRTFNTCDFEFIARMSKYQPSKPCQFYHSNQNDVNSNNNNNTAKAPHFKSIARIFQNHVAMQKRGVPPADTYFSWFLLTSACLSMGAQGAAIDKVRNPKQHSDIDKNIDSASSSSFASTVSYRNFELGVLFVSHLPKVGKPQSKTKRFSAMGSSLDQERQRRRSVVYCFRPHRRACGDSSNTSTKAFTPQLVHLPVPYNLKPESYFKERSKEGEEEGDDDDDDVVMNENPFFHEVVDGSRCIGNMLLTPFGQRESNQTSHV